MGEHRNSYRVLYAGADLRERLEQQDDAWTPDRRDEFLLRPDVIRPLSVDRDVWGTAPGHEDPRLPWISVDEVLRRALIDVNYSYR